MLKRRTGYCLSILLGALTDDNCLAAADSAQAGRVSMWCGDETVSNVPGMGSSFRKANTQLRHYPYAVLLFKT